MKKYLTLIITISLLLFLVTVYLSTVDSVREFEKGILEIIPGFRFPILDSIVKFISSFGDGISAVITFAVFAAALFIRGFKKELAFSFLIWVGPIASWGLKAIIARPRPEGFLIEGYPIPSGFSFPSGHVVLYVVFFGVVALYAKYLPNLTNLGRKILLTTSIILISLIGISRIYLGVHWPMDVVAGYLLGFAILGVIILIYFRSGVVQRG